MKFCKNEGLVLLADEVSDGLVADVRRQNNTKKFATAVTLMPFSLVGISREHLC